MAHAPFVRLVGPSGRVHDLRPGDLVGRSLVAGLRLPDPRVSEAHAMVVLRGRGLHLLALRGELVVEGEIEDCLALEVGQTITLCEGINLRVAATEVPSSVLGLEVDGDTMELAAPVYSLLTGPPAQLVPSLRPHAAARIWSTGEEWMIGIGTDRPVRLRADKVYTVGNTTLRSRMLPVGGLETAHTQGPGRAALIIVGRTATAHLLRAEREPVVLAGLKARLVTELGLMAAPTPWGVLAELLWPNVDDNAQRRRLDKLVAKLRTQLREHGVRDNLVHASGTGSFELLLQLGDRFVDEA